MRNTAGGRAREIHEMVDGIDAADPFPGSIPLLEDGHLNVSLQVGGAGRLAARVSLGWSIVLPAVGDGIAGVVIKAIVESRNVIRHAVIGSQRTCRCCRAEARTHSPCSVVIEGFKVYGARWQSCLPSGPGRVGPIQIGIPAALSILSSRGADALALLRCNRGLQSLRCSVAELSAKWTRTCWSNSVPARLRRRWGSLPDNFRRLPGRWCCNRYPMRSWLGQDCPTFPRETERGLAQFATSNESRGNWQPPGTRLFGRSSVEGRACRGWSRCPWATRNTRRRPGSPKSKSSRRSNSGRP